MINNLSYDEIKNILSKRLNEKRYHHSLCVADEAKRLAEKYGGDPEKCYLAGLIHDITKNAPEEEHLKIFETFGIMLSDIEKNAKKLWHAMSGSVYIKYVLNISDEEIIDAVRYHTTAKADMSLTAKILYLADFTSADRDYDDVDVMRQKVEISIKDAMIYSLRYSINDLISMGRAIHPDTLSAYNQVIMN